MAHRASVNHNIKLRNLYCINNTISITDMMKWIRLFGDQFQFSSLVFPFKCLFANDQVLYAFEEHFLLLYTILVIALSMSGNDVFSSKDRNVGGKEVNLLRSKKVVANVKNLWKRLGEFFHMP